MKLRVVLFLLISIVALAAFSQEPGETTPSGTIKPADTHRYNPSFTDRSYVGGGLGALFNTYSSFVEVSPLFGYHLSERLSVGVGGSYIYHNNKVYDYVQNIFGGRVFSRYQLFNFLFVHGEYEHLFLKVIEEDGLGKKYVYQDTAPGLLAGLGLSSYMSERTMFYTMILYNLLDTSKSPYGSPWVIRVGFNVGL